MGILEQKVEKFRGLRALGGSNDTSIYLPFSLLCSLVTSYNFRGPSAGPKPSLGPADVRRPLPSLRFAGGPTMRSTGPPHVGFTG